MRKTAQTLFILNPFRSFSSNHGGVPRFFAWVGFSVFAGILLAAFLGKEFSLIAAVAAGLSGIFVLALRRKADFVPVVLVSVSLAFSLYTLAFSARVEPWLELAGQQAKICGELLDYPEQEYQKYYYRLRVTEIEREGGQLEAASFTLRLSANLPLYAEPYDQVECEVGFYAFEPGGLYSSRNARLAQGIPLGAYLTGYNSVLVTKPEQRPVFAFLPQARRYMKRCVNRLFPEEEASLINAMLLGDRSKLSQDRVSDFRKLGASHLLVISGLHMSALVAFLGLVLKTLRVRRRVRNVLCAVGILAFLALLGFPFSASRSGVMLILFLMADCWGQEADSLNSLGASVFLICLGNPLAGGDLGFALSVLSTLGISVFHPKIYGLMKNRLETRPVWRWGVGSVCASLSVSFSVMVFTLPIQLFVFGGLSFIAPLSALLLIFPCTVLLYLSAICLLLALLPIFSPGAAPFVFAAGLLAKAVLWVAERLARLPVPFGAVSDEAAFCLLCFLGFLWLFILFIERRKIMVFAAALVSIGVFAFACVLEQESLQGELTIAVADAGEDSCVVLMKDGEAAALTISGYDTRAALSMLERCNIKTLNFLYLSDDSWQGWESARRLLRSYEPRQVLVEGAFYLGKDRNSLLEGLSVQVAEPNEIVDVLEGVKAVFEEGRITLLAEGSSVMIETEQTGEGSCDLLITNQLESQVNSPFTVLQTDDIISLEESGRESYCLLAAESRVTRLRLKAGEISFRQGEH